jgi:SM-20-related protein
MTASASRTGSQLLNLSKLEQAALKTEPFEYVLVPDFLDAAHGSALLTDFPGINRIGSFPLSTLTYGERFQCLIDELLGPEFEQCVSRKFGMDLSQYPTMITVRGQCSATSDGHIHTDSREKLITVLLYLNPDWSSGGGKLRLLRSKNLEDMAAEVPPTFGSLLIFKRCDWSWHGHKPFEGKRLSLQMNWVASDRYGKREQFRHKVSSFIKQLFGQSRYEG